MLAFLVDPARISSGIYLNKKGKKEEVNSVKRTKTAEDLRTSPVRNDGAIGEMLFSPVPITSATIIRSRQIGNYVLHRYNVGLITTTAALSLVIVLVRKSFFSPACRCE